MILATYNCFQIPLDVAFNPPGMKIAFLKVLGGVIDLVFLVDIFVSFRTTFLSPYNGQEITDIK
jgi:hypothetical protein